MWYKQCLHILTAHVSLICSYNFDVFCCLLLNRYMATWNLFFDKIQKICKKKTAALVTELDFKWQGMLEKKTQLIPTATDHAYLSFTSNATIESAEWNNLLFGYHILQISVGLAYMQTLNGHSRLVCVLEVHTKIRTSRFTRLCWILWIGCVPSHLVLFYLP